MPVCSLEIFITIYKRGTLQYKLFSLMKPVAHICRSNVDTRTYPWCHSLCAVWWAARLCPTVWSG